MTGRREGVAVLPPVSCLEAEARARRISAMLRNTQLEAAQDCLNRAVRLATQAASFRGPLVEHFIELGRRFADYEEPELPGLAGGRGA